MGCEASSPLVSHELHVSRAVTHPATLLASWSWAGLPSWLAGSCKILPGQCWGCSGHADPSCHVHPLCCHDGCCNHEGPQNLLWGWWKLPEGIDGVELWYLAESTLKGGPVQQLLREQLARVPHGPQLPSEQQPVAISSHLQSAPSLSCTLLVPMAHVCLWSLSPGL